MTTYRDRRGGNYWTSSNRAEDNERCQGDEIAVYPVGGGFLHRIPSSELEEAEIPNDMIVGWATFDDDPDIYKCTYNPHRRWNGWHEPSFTKFVLDKIVQCWESTLVKDDVWNEDTEDYEWWRIIRGDDRIEHEEDGIYVTHHKKTGVWTMDGVCWQCYSDEKIEELSECWKVDFRKHQ